MINWDHVVLTLLLGGPALLAVLLPLGGYLAMRLHRRLLARYQFKYFNRGFWCLLAVMVAAAALLYLGDATGCRQRDPLPMIVLIFTLVLASVIALAAYNCRRTNVTSGLLATLVQLTILTLVLAGEAMPAMISSALSGMDSGGMHAQTDCGR